MLPSKIGTVMKLKPRSVKTALVLLVVVCTPNIICNITAGSPLVATPLLHIICPLRQGPAHALEDQSSQNCNFLGICFYRFLHQAMFKSLLFGTVHGLGAFSLNLAVPRILGPCIRTAYLSMEGTRTPQPSPPGVYARTVTGMSQPAVTETQPGVGEGSEQEYSVQR